MAVQAEPTTERAPRKRRTLADRAVAAVVSITAIPGSLLHWSRRRPVTPGATLTNPFVLPQHPPGVGPNQSEATGIAQDEQPAVNASFAWAAQNAIYSAYAEGLVFLGFPYLATLSQRPEYRVVTETIASEMTREWIEFKSVSNDENKADRIKEMQKADRDYGIQELLRKTTESDGFFGRGHIFVDNGEEGDDLKASLGDGRSKTSKGKVGKRTKLSFRSIDAMWCYPTNYNSNNPLKPDWYKPQHWFVMQNEVHRTRLLTLVSREMPDLLKPAYSFGGLSLSQMMKPYVDNWLRTRQSISDMVHSFAVWVLKTNFNQRLALGGSDLENRVELFNNIRDNRGTATIDKETEEIENVSAPLGGLSDLQAQAQEQPAAIAQIPLVKYLGLQAKGLNACLTGDTLIETDQGLTPIRDVLPGQRVMTREGWAAVAKSGCTGYATELIEITVDGATLRCTADHRIWLPSINAFVSAVTVRPGHLLLCRGAIGTIRNTVDRLPIAGVFGGIEAMAIMPPGHPTAFRSCYTEKFGEFIKGQSRRATTFITRTKIAGTTRSRIWNCSQLLSMRVITVSQKGFSYIKRQSSTVSAAIAVIYSSCGSRREPCFAAIGAAVQIDGRTESHDLSRIRSVCAVFVASLSRLKERAPSIVHNNAELRARIEPPTAQYITANTRKNGCDRKNRMNSAMNVAVASVRRVPAKEFVYDIQVAPGYLPEFFANGICVHNSSEGELRIFYDRIHASQERLFRAPLTTIYGFIQLVLWGEIDDDITFDFAPLWQLDEAGKAAIQQQKATTRDVDIASGVISPEEGREAAAADPDSQYAGLDLSKSPAPGEQVEEGELDHNFGLGAGEGGGAGEEGGGAPLGGPRPMRNSRGAGNLTARAANFGGTGAGGLGGGDAGTPEGARKAWQDRQHAETTD